MSRVLSYLLVVLISAVTIQAQEAVAEFTLTDYLRRSWRNERVVFPVDPALHGRADVHLVDGAGATIPHQWLTTGEGKPAVAFLANLPALKTVTWRLLPGAAAVEAESPWTVEETPTYLEITNGITGVRLARTREVATTKGPILGFRLLSGTWIGEGSVTGVEATGYTLTTVADGPVFREFAATYELPGEAHWTLHVRLTRGEPVVRVEETFGVSKEAMWLLSLEAGWEPDSMLSRQTEQVTKVSSDLLGADRKAPLFVLESWNRWWNTNPHGQWLAIYKASGAATGGAADGVDNAAAMLGEDDVDATLEDEATIEAGLKTDMAMIGVFDAGVWKLPGEPGNGPNVEVMRKGVTCRLPLQAPARHWLFAALIAEPSLRYVGSAGKAPPCQQVLIRHGDIPLELVQTYTLDWGETIPAHPRLFMSEAQVAAAKEPSEAATALAKRLRDQDISIYNMSDWFYAYMATGDPKLKEKIVKFGLGHIQYAVDIYTKQNQFATLNHDLVRHYMTVASAMNIADLLLMEGMLEPAQARRVRALMAFAAYTMARPEVFDSKRGYNANPNMTSMTRCTLGTLACLLYDHPDAASWYDLAYGEWEHEVTHWSGPNGGWLEAPHYAVAALDPILGMAIATRRSGFRDDDLALHPQLKLTGAWLAKLIGPGDPRLGGDRSQQAIGNSYTGERTSLPAWFATLWREADPTFAGQMQWAWIEQGRPLQSAIGGFPASMSGFSRLMITPEIEPITPAWTSELFPASGAVFRGHFPSKHEMYLHYIQGPHHQHYDYDEGSIVFWGKGQPLIQEFGYYGRAPVSSHSVLDERSKRQLGWEGKIQDFATTDAADYLRGQRGGWQRQILFVKDTDPLGPNYVLLRDTLASKNAADWRIWIPNKLDLFGKDENDHPGLPDEIKTARESDLDDLHLDEKPPPPPHPGNPLRVIGRYQGDLAVYFAATPRLPVLSDRETHASGASGFDKLEYTMRSVHVVMRPGEPLTAVLYPLLKDEKTPTITHLADGRVIRIDSPAGTDYAILNATPFEFADGDLTLKTAAGLVQLRPTGVTLSLSQPGTLTYGPHTLESDTPTTKHFPK